MPKLVGYDVFVAPSSAGSLACRRNCSRLPDSILEVAIRLAQISNVEQKLKTLPRWPSSISSSANFLALLAAGALLLNLLVVGMAVLSLYSSRTQYATRASVATQNLAQLLENEIASTIDKIDLSLLSQQDEIARQLAGGGIDARALNTIFAQQLARQPDLNSLRDTVLQLLARHAAGNGPGGVVGSRTVSKELNEIVQSISTSSTTARTRCGRFPITALDSIPWHWVSPNTGRDWVCCPSSAAEIPGPSPLSPTIRWRG